MNPNSDAILSQINQIDQVISGQCLSSAQREEVVMLFLREIARLSPREVEVLRSAPAWAGRVAAADTILREMDGANTYAFASKRFAAFLTPTLLLLGGNSAPIFKAAIELLKKSLPNSRVVEMAGQEHSVMNTAPDLFARHVLEFLLKPA